MSFNKFLNCIIFCEIIICISEILLLKVEDPMKELVNAIHECGQQIQPPEGYNRKDLSENGSNQNNMISEKLLALFEKELVLILYQIYNNYVTNLWTDESDIRAGSKTQTIVDNGVINSNLEKTKRICSLILLCLDFMHTCSTRNSFVIAISYWHRSVCHTLLGLVAQISNTSKNNNSYSFSYVYVKNLCDQIKSIYTTYTNYPDVYIRDFDDEGFLQNVNRLITNINKMELIRKSKLPANTYILQSIIQHEYEYQNILFGKSNLNSLRSHKKEIDNRFNVINNNYKNSEDLQKCFPLDDIEYFQHEDYSTIMTVSTLLLYTLKNMGKFFRLNMSEFIEKSMLNDDKRSIHRGGIDVWMSNMFDAFCKRFPLLYLYISESLVEDTRLFSYYLAFCDDIVYFVTSRCPYVDNSTVNTLHFDVNCIIETMKDKLMWNFRATNTIPDDSLIDNQCACVYQGYIDDIYDVLFEHYDGEPVNVWNTFEWLSAKNFLTTDHRNFDMRNLKETKLKVNNVIMTLAEAYYLILPLNLNLNGMLIFHNIFVSHADRQLYLYICRHAMTIILYLDENYYAGTSALSYIQKSLKWYDMVHERFYKYVNMPVKHGPSLYTQNVITAIKELKSDSSDTIKLYIPDNIYKETFDWADEQFDRNDLSSLNELVWNNCQNAMKFLINFISIAQQSLSSYRIIDYHNNLNIYYSDKMIDRNLAYNMYPEYCKSTRNMFVSKSLLRSGKNILFKTFHT